MKGKNATSRISHLDPAQFRAEYKKRGWTNLTLAARWHKHPVSLSKIVNDPERAPHWDDAVVGLPEFIRD